MGTGIRFSGMGLVGLTIGAVTVTAALLLTGQAGGAPAPTSVVMTDVCVNPSKGQMSFPIGGICPAGYSTVAVDDPNATLDTCVLSSNGAIRVVAPGGTCTSAPRSKKETPLEVPSLGNDLYFCASSSDGALFFKGTSPVSCKSGQFLVVVEQANNAPVAAAGTLTTLEDALGTTSLSATDEDGDALTFALGTQGTKGTAALTGSASCNASTPSTCTRGASYTPQPNVNGSDSFSFTASDAFATSAPAMVVVMITPVNDAPSFTAGTDQSVGEDAGSQTAAGWATAISAGPANESIQTVSFSVTSNSNPSLFSSAPAVSPTGTLTYTPAANASGVATIQLAISDNGGTANGGIDTSAAQSFDITVAAVNDAPSFTAGGDETVLEDAGAQSVAGWATGIAAGPANEAGQNVSFTVTANTTPALFASGPAVAADGTLSYTPASDEFGSATITVKAVDDGTPPAESAGQSFTITVTPVNDAPSFGALTDPAAVNEDATAQSLAGFATGLSAGPANESGQALQFVIVSNSNESLFAGLAGLPLVSSSGTLTYAPAPNASGIAVIEIKLMDDGGTADGGSDSSATQQFTITVDAVNDAPSFQLPASPDQTVLEDAGAETVAGFATMISKGPADESGQTLTFNVSNDDNNLFLVQPAIDETTGDLTYTLAADANGSATVSVSLSDDGGGTDTSGTSMFEIDVTPVNDEPSFNLPSSPDQTVAQDAPAQTVAGFATSISAGPSDESGQTLTFDVSNDDNSLFSAQPEIDESSGDLTYTTAAGITGSATVSVFLTDSGGVANGGDDTSATQTFEITVVPPNAAPVAVAQTGGNAVAATEDGSAVAITLTATDADDDNLTFSIVGSPAKGTLGTIGTPDCSTTANECTATVSDTPAANGNGADSFTFKANDGGLDSNTATVEIEIAAVNDVPSFTKGADQTVFEDAGAQTVAGWATAISSGPADESGQTVTFTITGNTNPSLFSAAPAVASNGTLTYTPAANAFGSATVSLKAVDDGAPPAESATQSFLITVTGVNDAPVNTVPGVQSVDEDTALTFSGISVADVDAGTGSIQVTVSAQNGTITPATGSGATIGGSGTSSATITGTLAQANGALNGLTYTGNLNFNSTRGSESITVATNDQGNTGGAALSDTDAIAVTVNAVNDRPTAAAKSFTAQANMKITGLTGLLTGATDPDTGDGGYTASFTANVSVGAGCIGGTVSNVNTSTGTFDFDPPAGSTGPCTLAYTVTDTGNPGPGATSVPATITMTISGPVIWFVNPNAAVNGNGRLSSPFNVLSGADAVDAANHRVFVYTGPTTTGLVLNAGEWLIGQGAGAPGDTFDALVGITPPAGTIARPSIAGTRPTLGGTVALNTNAVVRGLNITTTGATALSDPGESTGVSVSQANLNASNAAAVDLTGTGGTITLDATTSSGSAGSGIALTNVTAAFTGGSGAITNATSADVAINGGNGTFDYNGSIIDDVGALVTVASTTGGTKSFDGVISDGNDGDGSGISLTNNNAATTVNFTATLMLSTGANPAFTATGGGTVNVTGPANTIATTTGTALNVANATIGASGLTFRSISSNGAASGIVLNNTGASGGLTITGTGAAGTGGTIQQSTGAGIVLASTRSPSFSWMVVQLNGDDGIRGSSVDGFTLANSTVFGNGQSVNEHGIDFVGGLTGTASISSSTVNGSGENHLIVTNATGSLNLTVTGSSFLNSSTVGNDGIHLDANDTAAITASITGSTFDNNRGDHFQFSTNATSTGTNSVTFSSNTLTGDRGAPFGDDLGAGITISTTGSSDTAFTVANNNIQGAVFPTIGIDLGTSSTVGATLSGTVDGNTIGNAAVAASGGAQSAAIAAVGQGAGTLTAAVTNNTIRQNDGFAAIDILSRDGSPTINATVTGNSIANPSAGGGNGLLLRNGAITTDGGFTCAAITGNILAGSAVAGLDDFRLRQRFNTTVRLPGYANTAGNTAAVVAFVQGNNPGVETGSATVDFPVTGGGFVGGAACPTP